MSEIKLLKLTHECYDITERFECYSDEDGLLHLRFGDFSARVNHCPLCGKQGKVAGPWITHGPHE